MIKKKAKRKQPTKKAANKNSSSKSEQEFDPAEVRKDIAQMVDSQATAMAQAVIDGEKGQLATVKYLFEVAEIYPPATDGSHTSADEECLAKTLLNRLNIPDEPIGGDEDDESRTVVLGRKAATELCREEQRKDPEPGLPGEVKKESVLV